MPQAPSPSHLEPTRHPLPSTTQTDCNLALYMNAATVNGQVVTSRSLTTVTNTNTIVICKADKSFCKKHPDSNTWSYGIPSTTTTAFPFLVWATNTSTTSGLCNLYLSNEGNLTVNNTYAQTVWSVGGEICSIRTHPLGSSLLLLQCCFIIWACMFEIDICTPIN